MTVIKKLFTYAILVGIATKCLFLLYFSKKSYINYSTTAAVTNHINLKPEQKHQFKSENVTPQSTFDELSSPNLATRVADLVNTKYNYTKQFGDLSTAVTTESHFTQLPKIFEKCLSDIKINVHCQLPNNISLVIHNALGGLFSKQSKVYNITIFYDRNNDTNYVLKIYGTSFFNFETQENEYTLVTNIRKYMQYYNLSYESLPIPTIHPTIPAYETTKHFLIFYQQIRNVITWNEIIHKAKSLLPSLITVKGSIINFLEDCYSDIMKVFQVFYEMGFFQNDFKFSNVLIDTHTFQCYVIDFGAMFQKWWLTHPKYSGKRRDKVKRVRYYWPLCSPVVYYHLSELSKRHQFIADVFNFNVKRKKKLVSSRATDLLSKMVMYSEQYNVAICIFHTFIRLYFLQTHQENNALFQLNEAISQNMIIENKQNLLQNPDKFNVTYFWCSRYELYRKLMVMFNAEDQDMYSNNLKQRLFKIINVIDDDVLFLNSKNCPFIHN